VPDAKGRSAGLGKCILLLLTASLIELVAYFYQGSFMPIGIAIFVTIMLFSLLIQKAIKNKWLIFEEH
jgi:DHA1 family bicyclomycin/chloramphenicol resistance-like MFS transporter